MAMLCPAGRAVYKTRNFGEAQEIADKVAGGPHDVACFVYVLGRN
jgi:hypothetical protein